MKTLPSFIVLLSMSAILLLKGDNDVSFFDLFFFLPNTDDSDEELDSFEDSADESDDELELLLEVVFL